MTTAAYWTIYAKLLNKDGVAPSESEVSQVRVHYVGDTEIHLTDANYTASGLYALSFSSHWFSALGDTAKMKFRVYNANGQEFYSIEVDNVANGQTVEINIDGGVVTPPEWTVAANLLNSDGSIPDNTQISKLAVLCIGDGGDILLAETEYSSTGNYQFNFSSSLLVPVGGSPTLRFLVYDTDSIIISSSSYAGFIDGQSVDITINVIEPPFWNTTLRLTNNDGSIPSSDKVLKTAVFCVTQSGDILLSEAPFISSGIYQFNFPSELLMPLGTTSPMLRFKVYDNSNLEIASATFSNFSNGQSVSIVLSSGVVVDPSSETYVFGTVNNQHGLPVLNVRIRAFHVDIVNGELKENVLSNEVEGGYTDAISKGPDGYYSLRYDIDQIPMPEDGSERKLNLLVCADLKDEYDNWIENSRSYLMYDAGMPQEYNVTVDKAGEAVKAEFYNISSDLSVYIMNSSVHYWANMEKISNDSIYCDFISKKCGWSSNLIAAYVRSELFAQTIKDQIDAITGGTVEEPVLSSYFRAEVLYPLFRNKDVDDLKSLLGISGKVLFEELQRSVNERIISSILEHEILEILGDWKKILVYLTLNPDTTIPDSEDWKKQLLDLAYINETGDIVSEKTELLNAYFDFEGTFIEFCNELENLDYELVSSDMLNNIRFVFELYERVGKIYEIVYELYLDKANRGWKEINDLATVKVETGEGMPNGWVDYVNQILVDFPTTWVFPSEVTGLNPDEQIRSYAVLLKKMFQNVGEEKILKVDIEEESKAQDPGNLYENIDSFLTNEAFDDFSIKETYIDKYIEEKDLTDTPATPVLTEPGIDLLKTIQRLYRITSEFKCIKALIDRGYSSAVKIAQKEVDEFIVEMENTVGGIIPAERIHGISVEYATHMLFHIVQFHENTNVAGSGTAIPNHFRVSDVQQESRNSNVNPKFPNWMTLFADETWCTSNSHETILSPSSYFVDLINFLKEEPGLYNKLIQRRPELEHIELTSTNTFATLPYIDIVNEILEDAINPRSIEIPYREVFPSSYFDNVLNTTPKSYWEIFNDGVNGDGINNVFYKLLKGERNVLGNDNTYTNGCSYILSQKAMIKLRESNTWIIEDSAWRYIINREEGGFVVTPYPQTDSENKYRNVAPEHVNDFVYDNSLANAIFPFNAPFSLGKEETNLLLSAKDKSLYDILTQFDKTNKFDSYTGDLKKAFSIAYLNLTTNEESTIFISETVSDPWLYWGFTEESMTGVPIPHTPTLTNDGYWYELLSQFTFLMHRASVTYEELLDVLDTRFINQCLIEVKPGDTDVNFATNNVYDYVLTCYEDDGETVSVEKLKLTLMRINSMVRLWKHLGWDIRDVDRYLSFVGSSDDDRFKLCTIKKLVDEYNVSVSDALCLLGYEIDIRRTARFSVSKYDELFITAEKASLEFDALEELSFTDWFEGVALTGNLNGVNYDIVPYLCKGFGINKEDFYTIYNTTSGKSNYITRVQLQIIMQVALFCKVSGVSVKEYYEYVNYSSSLFEVGSSSDIIETIKNAKKINSLVFNDNDLNDLASESFLSQTELVSSKTEMFNKAIDTLMGIKNVYIDENRNAKLTAKPDADEIIEAFTSIFDSDKEITELLVKDVLKPIGLSDSLIECIKDELVNEDKKWILHEDADTCRRTTIKIPESGTYNFNIDSGDNLEINGISVTSSIDFILNEGSYVNVKFTDTSSGDDSPILNWSVDSGATFTAVEDDYYCPIDLRIIEKFRKALLIISKLELNKKIVSVISDKNILNFNSLPFYDNPDSSSSINIESITNSLMNCKDVINLDEVKCKSGTILDFIEADEFSVTKRIIAKNTGWSENDIDLLEDLYFDSSLTNKWQDLNFWYYCVDMIKLSQNVGTTIGELAQLINEENPTLPTMSQSSKLRRLMQNKYSEKAIESTFKPLRDKLRIKQRDALTAYLCSYSREGEPDRNFIDRNDLYTHFLIDVSMQSDTETSRIVQAISTIQLIVHRALLELEGNNSILDEKRAQWDWYKNYRLWEANRKVFMYPENWIEPELRDDKTPFFKELEEELLQKECNHIHAEEVLGNYLEKVREVGHLDVAGGYTETFEDSELIRRVHIIGRTRANPKIYYYRKNIVKEDDNGIKRFWTPWVKIDLEIKSEVVMPVVFRNKFYLFWPMFTLKQDSPKNKNEIPASYIEIRMQWSEYNEKENKWTKPKISKNAIYDELKDTETAHDHTAENSIEYDKYSFMISIPEDNGSMKIEVLSLFDRFRNIVRDYHLLDEVESSTNVVELLRENRELFTRLIESKKAYKSLWKSLVNIANPHEVIKYFHGWRRNTDLILDCVDNEKEMEDVRKILIDILKETTTLEETTYSPRMHGLGYFSVGQNNYDRVTIEESVKKLAQSRPWYTCVVNNTAKPILDYVESYLYLGSSHAYKVFEKIDKYYSLHALNFDYLEGDTSKRMPFVYQSSERSYYAEHSRKDDTLLLENFYHPAIEDITSCYNRLGAESIMNRPVQALHGAQMQYDVTPSKEGAGTSNKQVESKSNVVSFAGTIASSMLSLNVYSGKNGELGYYIAGDSVADSISQNDFTFKYFPTQKVQTPYPRRVVDFKYGSTYGIYNWEIFFHIPLLMADRLSQNMKFVEALKWLHFIFDPLGNFTDYERTKRWAKNLGDGAKYWNFLPFFANKDAKSSLYELMGLSKESRVGDPKSELINIVNDWKDDPFSPHLIARYRNVAYQKKVIMKYLDILIAWADNLFAEDSTESINEATQLYALADEMLGKKPEKVATEMLKVNKADYTDLNLSGTDEFSNALFDFENVLIGQELILGNKGKQFSKDVSNYLSYMTKLKASGLSSSTPVSQLKTMIYNVGYFRIPMNEKLLTYWDTVADRLFKIRNSLNIDGEKRSLALFQPPIDPGMLVRAKAAGVSISNVLSNFSSTRYTYRFSVWMQKALDLCNELKSFGGAILQAIEKKDAEALQLLRSDQELKMLDLSTKVKKLQVEEANAAIEGLLKQYESANARFVYYDTRKKKNPNEENQITLLKESSKLDNVANALSSIAGVVALIPQFHATFVVDVETGGESISGALNAAATAINAISSSKKSDANISSIEAGFERRWDDWQLQKNLADFELKQLDEQIKAAEIRLEIAEKDLEHHEINIEEQNKIRDYMENKFSNKELYNWMLSQLSLTFKEVYKLAFEVAKTAEAAYDFELGTQSSSFIKFGYGDSLHRGLLAGEKLVADLKRMEISYLKNNIREYEITKSISLKDLNSSALMELITTGKCDFAIPEVVYDLDYAGQYFRRIKSVKLSIPCVTGPNTNVSAKLKLNESRIRIDTRTENKDDYPYGSPGYESSDGTNADTRFLTRNQVQSIATSTAQNDSGVFELNFKDDRYLPFEGAGAISSWSLELPTAYRQFDYSSISDVVVHISYTSRHTDTLKEYAEGSISDMLNEILKYISSDTNGLVRNFSLSAEFPNILHELKNSSTGSTIIFGKEHFPYILKGIDALPLKDNICFAYLKLKEGASGLPTLSIRNSVCTDVTPDDLDGYLKYQFAFSDPANSIDNLIGNEFLLEISDDDNEIKDIILEIPYLV